MRVCTLRGRRLPRKLEIAAKAVSDDDRLWIFGGSRMPNGTDGEVWTFTIHSAGWRSLGLPPPPD
jgi:hypothetical protein